MNPIPIGVCGVGHFGSLHAQKLAHLPEAELRGLYDIDPDVAKNTANLCGCRAFDRFDALLSECRALVIATPAVTHAALAERALLAGVHVLVEKPLATTKSDAARLLELSDRLNLTLQVGHIERFHPQVRALKQRFSKQKPAQISFTRTVLPSPKNRDVGALLDLMIHDLDLALWFCSGELQLLRAERFFELERTEEAASAELLLGNTRVSLDCDRSASKRLRQIDADGEVIDLSLCKDDLLLSELRAFTDACLYQKAPVVTGREARTALDCALDLMAISKLTAR